MTTNNVTTKMGVFVFHQCYDSVFYDTCKIYWDINVDKAGICMASDHYKTRRIGLRV